MTVSVKSTEQVTNADGRKLLISKIPDKYKTDPYYLANVAVVAMIAYFCAGLFGNKISPTIFALILGLILGEFCIIERDALRKAHSFGFVMTTSLLAAVADI